MTLRERLEALRAGPAPYDQLETLWADCPPVRAADVLRSWAGSDFGPGHPVHEMLATSAWHGKRFESVRTAHPLICRGPDGELFSNAELGQGLASLWDAGPTSPGAATRRS